MDDEPVIRPVLPSRQGTPTPEPMWDGPLQPDTAPLTGALTMIPRKPRSTAPVKNTKSKKDPRRSAAAKIAWQNRRKTQRADGTARATKTVTETAPWDILTQMIALLNTLPHEKRRDMVTVLQGLVS
jgi:hypothetical protein